MATTLLKDKGRRRLKNFMQNDSKEANDRLLLLLLFLFGATAPSGPGPPHSQGF
jgi:hypothetical protein